LNSRSKGKRGELEASKAWVAAVGGTARRGQQFSGGTDSPDVVTDCGAIHLEVKRTERGNPYGWVDQAVRDAKDNIPVVLHRRSRREWLCIVRLTDVSRLAEEIAAHAQSVGGRAVPRGVSGACVPEGQGPDGREPGVV